MGVGLPWIIAYGGLYDQIVGPIVLSPGIEVQVPITTQMPSENIVYGTSSIQIVEAGNYQISYMLNFSSSADTSTIQPFVSQNGLSISSLSQAALLSNDSSSIVTANTIATLSSGDVIGLYLISAAGGSISFQPDTNVMLSLNKISSN